METIIKPSTLINCVVHVKRQDLDRATQPESTGALPLLVPHRRSNQSSQGAQGRYDSGDVAPSLFHLAELATVAMVTLAGQVHAGASSLAAAVRAVTGSQVLLDAGNGSDGLIHSNPSFDTA